MHVNEQIRMIKTKKVCFSQIIRRCWSSEEMVFIKLSCMIVDIQVCTGPEMLALTNQADQAFAL